MQAPCGVLTDDFPLVIPHTLRNTAAFIRAIKSLTALCVPLFDYPLCLFEVDIKTDVVSGFFGRVVGERRSIPPEYPGEVVIVHEHVKA